MDSQWTTPWRIANGFPWVFNGCPWIPNAFLMDSQWTPYEFRINYKIDSHRFPTNPL